MGKYDLNSGNIITPVQSTFVDPGVETFKQAAILYRQQYDKNKDAYNLTKRAMAQMELMPGDEKAGLRDQFVGNIDKNFESVLESGAFEDATNAVQQNIDYVMTDKTVNQAQKNALQFQKEEAMIEQFGPSGILDFNKGARESFTTVSADEEGNEVVNSYKEKMEQKEDYNAYMKDLIGTIAQSGGGAVSGLDINGDDIMDYLQTGNTKGVSRAKMERVVNNMLGNYLDSKVGDQDMRRLTQIQGMSEGDAKIDILNRMKGIGNPQVGVTTTTSNQEYKLNAASGYGGGGGDLTQDNWAVQDLVDGKTNISTDVYIKMTGNEANVSKDIPGGVRVSGQEGITIDYSRFVGDDVFNNIDQELVKNNIVSNTQEASQISRHLLDYLVAEEAGNTEDMRRISLDMGIAFDVQEEREKLQVLSQFAQSKIDMEQLQTMGSFLSGPVDGVFRPNSGATENAQWINGNAVIDGEYFFTEEQMDNRAKQSGLGTTGWLPDGILNVDWESLPWTSTDVDEIEDAQGNKIFRKVTENENTYWVMKGKSARIKGEKIQADTLYYAAGHTPTQYKDNESTILRQRVAARKISENTEIAYQNTVNLAKGLPTQTAAVVKNAFKELKNVQGLLEQANPVGFFNMHANAMQKLVVRANNEGKSAQAIYDILETYKDNIGKKQE
jgi:hypothetical protein